MHHTCPLHRIVSRSDADVAGSARERSARKIDGGYHLNIDCYTSPRWRRPRMSGFYKNSRRTRSWEAVSKLILEVTIGIRKC